MIITIDGLGVNGKSTLSKMLADHFKYKNFNTGAIYRCIALKIINEKLDINDISNTLEQLKDIDINFESEKVYLDGIDVSKKIRTEEISFYSTKWATIPEIKEFVRVIQKEYIKKYDTIIEGRDIATRIAPNADYKFYLYSEFETRVQRLWKQNTNISIDNIRNDLKIRDNLDINGGNFIQPKDAIEIDTTNYNIDEVFEIMVNYIK